MNTNTLPAPWINLRPSRAWFLKAEAILKALSDGPVPNKQSLILLFQVNPILHNSKVSKTFCSFFKRSSFKEGLKSPSLVPKKTLLKNASFYCKMKFRAYWKEKSISFQEVKKIESWIIPEFSMKNKTKLLSLKRKSTIWRKD